MTLMGIQYLNHQEQARHNLATEAETNRANLANETETNRANVARETETNRSNLVKEAETNRANLAHERETNRSNLAKENETRRHNWQTEQIEGKKAEYQKAHNEAMERIQRDANFNNMLKTILEKSGTVESRTVANNLMYHLSKQGYNVPPGSANRLLKITEDYLKEHPGTDFGQGTTNVLSNVWGELKGFLGSLLK